MKKAIKLCLIIMFCLTAVSCGKDIIKMSLEKVGEEVCYNKSMTGAGDVFYNHIKEKINFTDTDPNKVKYITNTLHYGEVPALNVKIQNGRYYEARQEIDGKTVCRGIVVFLEFDTAENATTAVSAIAAAQNKKPSPDGIYNLNLCGVAQNKNDLMVYYFRDSLAETELQRVFKDKVYVK